MIQLFAKPVLAHSRQRLKLESESFKSKSGRAPHLSVILVGDDPASEVYVGKKGEAAEAVGFTHETIRFPADTNAARVRQKLAELNANPLVDGILVQRPLPAEFKESEAVLWVDPRKDVDCLHPENVGLLVNGNPRFLPCTPGGILILLEHYQIPIKGKIACVVGRSSIVGKPLAALLLAHDATVIQVHRATPQPESIARLADLLFVAAGSRGLITADWIKPGAVVIDVGIHRDEQHKLSGDVDAAAIEHLASAITPVPGGVGPMTIQVLLENTLRSALMSVPC